MSDAVADVVEPLLLDDLPRDQVVSWLETMLLIREFETACGRQILQGNIQGGIHSSAGQEAVAVGAIRALEQADIVAGTHRSHHHAFAKGLSPDKVMAEIAGRSTGICGGRAGSMHLADHELGFFGGNGIVGAGVGIAMGASLAAKMRRTGQVAIGFVGEGGANTGRTWENVNLAAIWQLPLIVICENNMYAVETTFDRVTAGGSITQRASGFGLPALSVDGQDVAAMYRATKQAVTRARAGGGPTFIEARTYRFEGHSTGQVITYRTEAEVESWRRKDPLLRFRWALESAGLLEEGEYEGRLVEHARDTVSRAVEFAMASPWPEPATAAENVFGPRPARQVL